MNIWTDLKTPLPDREKESLPPKKILDKATVKASTITSLRKEEDYAFLIQRYTACRKGSANELRHCDIDLNKRVLLLQHGRK